MILHENRLPADDSQEIACLICYFLQSGKIFNCLLQIIGGALRVKYVHSLCVPGQNFLAKLLSIADLSKPSLVGYVINTTTSIVCYTEFSLSFCYSTILSFSVSKIYGIWKLVKTTVIHVQIESISLTV